MIWTRGLANGAHKGSAPDSGTGPHPPPAYTEASSTIWARTCIPAATNTEASLMIWTWTRGQANGVHEGSVHDSAPARSPPPAYTEAFPTIQSRACNSIPAHMKAPTTQVSPTIPLLSRQHHVCSTQPDKFPSVGAHRKILRFTPRSPLHWRSSPDSLNLDNPS